MSEEFDIHEVALDVLSIPSYCKRRHTSDQIERCVHSLELHDQYQPLVVSQNEIVCGVLVYRALRKMGRKTAWVHDLGPLPEERKKEIRYLDNQIFDIETWEEFKIKDLLMSLDRVGVERIAFTEDEAEFIINKEPPEPRKTKKDSSFNEIWVCDSCGWTGTLDQLKKREI